MTMVVFHWFLCEISPTTDPQPGALTKGLTKGFTKGLTKDSQRKTIDFTRFWMKSVDFTVVLQGCG